LQRQKGKGENMKQEINPNETSRAQAFELWMNSDLT